MHFKGWLSKIKGNKDGLLHGLIRRAVAFPVRPHKVSNKVSFIEILPFSTEKPRDTIQVLTDNSRRPEETYSLGASAADSLTAEAICEKARIRALANLALSCAAATIFTLRPALTM